MRVSEEQDAPPKDQLVQLLRKLAIKEGFSPSPLAGVQYILGTRYYPPAPVVYDPSIIVIAQGRKRGYVGKHVYTFDAYNYLVLSVPLPFECETEASAETPLLGVSIKVEPALLGELILEMDPVPGKKSAVSKGIYATPLNDALISAVVRLLQCFEQPQDCRILGNQIVREIVYRVLCGEQSETLHAIAAEQSGTMRISQILHRIHTEYHDSRLNVERLAREAGMSLSVFHHSFKAITLTSPLQYLKNVRLHKARMIMLMDSISASSASKMVGYESPSQFSREFKRLFGNSPVKEITRMRTVENEQTRSVKQQNRGEKHHGSH